MINGTVILGTSSSDRCTRLLDVSSHLNQTLSFVEARLLSHIWEFILDYAYFNVLNLFIGD